MSHVNCDIQVTMLFMLDSVKTVNFSRTENKKLPLTMAQQ